MTPAQAKKLGDCVKRFARSKAGYAILGNDLTSYSAGGCWILASALEALTGEPLLALLGVQGLSWDTIPKERWPKPSVQHVALRATPQLVIDANGAQEDIEFLKYWSTQERIRRPRLEFLFLHQQDAETGISCDPRRVKLVYGTLKAMCR